MSYFNGSFITNFASLNRGAWTFEDDFSGTDNWTDAGTLVQVNTTTDVIDWDGRRNATNQATYYDLTTVSDSSWLLRFKLTISSISAPSTVGSHFIGIFLSSTAGSSDSGTSRDCIGLAVLNRDDGGQTKEFHYLDRDGSAWEQGTPGVDAFTTVPTTTTYYVEIKRTSATGYTVSLYSDSNYSSLTESKSDTIASSLASLRYIVIQNDNNDTLNNCTFNGTIDNIQFINGQSTAP